MNRLYVVEVAPDADRHDGRSPPRRSRPSAAARARAARSRPRVGVAGRRALPPRSTPSRPLGRGRGARPRGPPRARRWSSPARRCRPRRTRWSPRSTRRSATSARRSSTPSRSRPQPVDDLDLARRAGRRRSKAGEVDLLVVLGVNPVYDAPADLDFAEALAKAPALRIHHGLYDDETAALLPVARAGRPLPRELGRRARLRRHGRADPAADRAALRRQDASRAARPPCSAAPTRRAYDLVREHWQAQLRRRAFEPAFRKRAARRRASPAPRCAPSRRPSGRRRARRGRRRARRARRPAASLELALRARSRPSSTAASPTTAGCRSCPSRSPS